MDNRIALRILEELTNIRELMEKDPEVDRYMIERDKKQGFEVPNEPVS